MPNPILVAENGAGRIFRVGIAGYDTESQDLETSPQAGDGYDYTAELISEFQGPGGGYTECLFKMITLTIRRSVGYTMSMKVYVDDAQTSIFDSNGDLVDQNFSFTESAPTQDQFAGGTECETDIEAHLGPNAIGHKLSVHLTITSSNISGLVMPEEVLVHFLPFGVKQSSTGETQ